MARNGRLSDGYPMGQKIRRKPVAGIIRRKSSWHTTETESMSIEINRGVVAERCCPPESTECVSPGATFERTWNLSHLIPLTDRPTAR
jgi:hypothetical protein